MNIEVLISIDVYDIIHTYKTKPKRFNRNSTENPFTDILDRDGSTPRSLKPVATNVIQKVPYEEVGPPVGLPIYRLNIGPQDKCPLKKYHRERKYREQNGHRVNKDDSNGDRTSRY